MAFLLFFQRFPYAFTSLFFIANHAAANMPAVQSMQLSRNGTYRPESTSSLLFAFMPICISA